MFEKIAKKIAQFGLLFVFYIVMIFLVIIALIIFRGDLSILRKIDISPSDFLK